MLKWHITQLVLNCKIFFFFLIEGKIQLKSGTEGDGRCININRFFLFLNVILETFDGKKLHFKVGVKITPKSGSEGDSRLWSL